MRTRQWAPMFVLVVTALVASEGYRQTGHNSWPWTLAGMALALVAVLVIDYVRASRDTSGLASIL